HPLAHRPESLFVSLGALGLAYSGTGYDTPLPVDWTKAERPHARSLLTYAQQSKGLIGVTDVLLTHSYHLFYDRKQMRKMQPYPPLGTLYAAALLRSKGISVAMYDTMLNNPDDGFQIALDQHHPRVVVVYEDNFNFLSKMCLSRMREVAFRILKASRQRGA